MVNAVPARWKRDRHTGDTDPLNWHRAPVDTLTTATTARTPTNPHARSPDGTKLALTTYKSSLIQIVDLEQMKVVRELRLPDGGEARALEWVTDDRLIAVAQRMSRPTRRYVRERTAVTFDPATGRIVARRPLKTPGHRLYPSGKE